MDSKFKGAYEEVPSTFGINDECFMFDSSDYWGDSDSKITESLRPFITVRARVIPVKSQNNNSKLSVTVDKKKLIPSAIYANDSLSNKFKYRAIDCQHQAIIVELVDTLDSNLEGLENNVLYRKEFITVASDHNALLFASDRDRRVFGYGGYYNESANLRDIGQIFYEPRDGFNKSLLELSSVEDWQGRGVNPPKQGIFKDKTVIFDLSINDGHVCSLYSDIKMGKLHLRSLSGTYKSYDVEQLNNSNNLIEIKLKQEEQ